MKAETFATMVAMALFASLTLSTPSHAEKINNSTAASLLTQCELADDTTRDMGGLEHPGAGYTVCCSKSLGYCVECPPVASQQCDKYPVQGRFRPPGSKVVTPAPDQLAPVVPKPKRINPRLKLQPGSKVTK
jgi:hypothetical protein